jgi:hypothetical protein
MNCCNHENPLQTILARLMTTRSPNSGSTAECSDTWANSSLFQRRFLWKYYFFRRPVIWHWIFLSPIWICSFMWLRIETMFINRAQTVRGNSCRYHAEWPADEANLLALASNLFNMAEKIRRAQMVAQDSFTGLNLQTGYLMLMSFLVDNRPRWSQFLWVRSRKQAFWWITKILRKIWSVLVSPNLLWRMTAYRWSHPALISCELMARRNMPPNSAEMVDPICSPDEKVKNKSWSIREVHSTVIIGRR